MSHIGNDAVIDQIRDQVAEMSHKEKVMTLLEYIYDSGRTINTTIQTSIAFNRENAVMGGYDIGGITVPYGEMSGLDAKVAHALIETWPEGGGE